MVLFRTLYMNIAIMDIKADASFMKWKYILWGNILKLSPRGIWPDTQPQGILSAAVCVGGGWGWKGALLIQLFYPFPSKNH